MRTIAVEEAFVSKTFRAGERDASRLGIGTSRSDFFDAYFSAPPGWFVEQLADLGAARLADMDLHGIDVQVLGHTNTEMMQVPANAEPEYVRAANDELAAAVNAHPDRFAGWALLPMRDPEAAVAEFRRAVTSLGFRGAMVNGAGSADGVFLDDMRYRPLLELASELDVPIYIHPGFPPSAVKDSYYSGFKPEINLNLMAGAWGWHGETGLHALRLIVAGVFEELPKLQIIIGHMGESVPFMLSRIDTWLPPKVTGLPQTPSEYFQKHFYITTSGFFDIPSLMCAVHTFGTDQILFAVDYPYSLNGQGRAFIESIPLSRVDIEKISHRNADRLLKLDS